MIEISWIFLLTVFMALNTILWAISYTELRAVHPKAEVEDLIDKALDIVFQCHERWPGTAVASQLYSKLAKACLRSYDADGSSHPPSSLSANSPSSLTDAYSPSLSEHSSATTGSLAHSQKAFPPPPPQFGNVFDQVPEQIPTFDFHSSLPPPQPSFRSNSIFANPSSMQSDRRFSYFPPDFTQPHALPNAWNPMALPVTPDQTMQPVSMSSANTPANLDPGYFLQQTPFPFNQHIFSDQGYGNQMRSGSLSQQQQLELMQTLETDGVTEIDNFMRPYQFEPIKYGSIKYEPIKYETVKYGDVKS